MGAAREGPLVLPYPREMRLGHGHIRIAEVAIHAAEPLGRQAARILRRELKALGIKETAEGFPVMIVRVEQPHAPDEMYWLQIKKDKAIIAAAAYPGFYYGIQTLRQLLQPQPAATCVRHKTKRGRGASPECACGNVVAPLCEITDYPLMPIRGVHTYLPARKHLPFFKRFLEWLGRRKINTLFLEIGGGMEYKRHPEINEAWERFCREAQAYPGGPEALQDSQWFWKNSTHTELAGGSYLTQEECRRIARWARENAIEIVPELQALSHSYYLCVAHPEIAEVKEDPWPDTYCPSDPRSYTLYFELLEEVIAVFQPRLIHIGHDEAYLFQFCPKCKRREAAEIYATDITKIRDWLAERGIRTAIWGDKLLEIHHPSGQIYGGVEREVVRYGRRFYMPATNRCKELIPRDVLILDWYWSLSYESAANLAEMGYELIYGNYHAPSFQNWRQYRANPALLGGETSCWCAVDDYSLGRNGTFHNILWGAINLWSDIDPEAEREGIVRDIAAAMREDRMFLSRRPSVLLEPRCLRFRPLDLTRAGRRGLYLGDTPSADLRFLPEGRQLLGSVPFVLPSHDKAGVPAVDWRIRATPPIPVNDKVDALCFVHTTTIEQVHAPTYYSLELGSNIVGAYLIEYADGRRLEVPLEYGMNIEPANCLYMAGKSGDMAATIGAYAYLADPALAGQTPVGTPYTLFMYEWVNPYPETPVIGVRLLWKAGYNKGVIALLAATAVQRI